MEGSGGGGVKRGVDKSCDVWESGGEVRIEERGGKEKGGDWEGKWRRLIKTDKCSAQSKNATTCTKMPSVPPSVSGILSATETLGGED